MMNITLLDCITSHLIYWMNFLKMLTSTSKTFKNSMQILTKTYKNDFPITAEFKNGEKITINSYHEMDFFSNLKKHKQLEINSQKNIAFITIKDKSVLKFFGGAQNGDIVNIFLKNEYGELYVKNKTVIDIGANIGDTLIYFVKNGAKKVIGIEPFPKNFELAIKNIELNKMKEKIVIVNAGCASKKGHVKIDPDICDTVSTVGHVKKGYEIPLVTLEQIIDEEKIHQFVLKIDCEGCEYDIIENMSKEVFKKISDICIEYHYGYQNLVKILKQEGFKVKIKKSFATNVFNVMTSKISRKQSRLEIGYVGFIFATKNFV